MLHKICGDTNLSGETFPHGAVDQGQVVHSTKKDTLQAVYKTGFSCPSGSIKKNPDQLAFNWRLVVVDVPQRFLCVPAQEKTGTANQLIGTLNPECPRRLQK